MGSLLLRTCQRLSRVSLRHATSLKLATCCENVEEMSLYVLWSLSYLGISRILSGSAYENFELFKNRQYSPSKVGVALFVPISQLICTLSYNWRTHCRLMSHVLVCSRHPKTTAEYLRQRTSFRRVLYDLGRDHNTNAVLVSQHTSYNWSCKALRNSYEKLSLTQTTKYGYNTVAWAQASIFYTPYSANFWYTISLLIPHIKDLTDDPLISSKNVVIFDQQKSKKKNK